jgi:hypothetical protein
VLRSLTSDDAALGGRYSRNVKVKKFNQARVNGGSNYDSLEHTHSYLTQQWKRTLKTSFYWNNPLEPVEVLICHFLRSVK